MRFKIIHETKYQFSSAVFLEPHYLRFQPKKTLHSTPEQFDIQVSPTPAGLSPHLDAENNPVHFCWFNDKHPSLTIKATSQVYAPPFNPFNFIIYPTEQYNLPIKYNDDQLKILVPALQCEQEMDNDMITFVEKVKQDVDHNTVQFISSLTQQIHKDFTVEIREDGAPYEAGKTFKLKVGSCRDIAWMEIQMLRRMGIAARFVSGYFYLESDQPEYELHAWIEVFLPGAGWIGFDPSHGIACGNTHIVVAASSNHKFTLPVTGTIRGSATSQLVSSLSIEPIA